MILQEMEMKIKVSWLDPEDIDKTKRKGFVRDKLLRLFGHEFGEQAVDQHGVKIEVVEADGKRISPEREIKDRRGVSSSESNR